MKFAIFAVNVGLCALMSGDRYLFHEFFEEPEGEAMQPIALCVLVVSASHLDKTAVSPGKGAYLKGACCLPQWLKETAKSQETVPGSVAEMMLN